MFSDKQLVEGSLKCFLPPRSPLRIAGGVGQHVNNLRMCQMVFMSHYQWSTVVCDCRCVYVHTPASRARPRHLHLHELHEESHLLRCHSHQLQTGYF